MKTIVKLVGLFMVLLLFAASCKKNSENPVVLRMLGWATGMPASGYASIFHTNDGGKTWVRQGDASQLPDASYADICILDSKTLIVAGDLPASDDYNVYLSVDGGTTWERNLSWGLRNVNYGGLCSLGMEHVWVVGDSGTIYRSDDSGNSWTRINVPAEYQEDLFYRVAANTIEDVWVVGDHHKNEQYPIMLHTLDGGNTWQRLNPVKDLNINIGGYPAHFLAVKLYGNSIWACGGFGRFIIRSGDQGVTWENITLTNFGDANDLFLLSETEAYIVEDNDAIYHTADGGSSWDTCSYNTGNFYTGIAVLDRQNLWVVGGPYTGTAHPAIIYSPDGGKSWQDQTPVAIKDNNIQPYKVRFIFGAQ